MENNNRELDNRTNNVLGSLSYLSIFFAPVLFPLIVWIVGEKPASTHSRNALIKSYFIVVIYRRVFNLFCNGTSILR